MLSAFTFREFRGINRRAGGIVCMYARVCVCPGSTAPAVAAGSPSRWRSKSGARIFGIRTIYAPLLAPLCKTEFQSTRKPPSPLLILAAAVLIANSTGDRCVPIRQEAFNPTRRRSFTSFQLSAPCPSSLCLHFAISSPLYRALKL